MNLKLYRISKFVFHEVFLDAQLQTAGSNQSKILERLENSKNTMRTQAVILKVVYMVLFIFLPIMPLLTYIQISDLLSRATFPIETALFTSSFLFCIFFGMTFIYLIIFGLMNTSSFMRGEVFKWLNTLPLPEKKLNKIGFLTIFRSLDLPLIVMFLAFPVIMTIGTRNIFVLITTGLTSIITVLFNFCLLILIGRRLSRVLSTGSVKDKKASAIRIFTMLGFILLSFLTSFFINLSFSSIGFFINLFASLQNANLFNLLLSLIPFPFSPAYLVALSTFPSQFSLNIWITTITGMLLFTLITYYVYKKAIKSLKLVTYTGGKTSITISKQIIKVERKLEITITSPIKAYLRKDLITATRDIQTLMFLIMPLIIPIIMSFSFVFALSDIPGGNIYLLIVSLAILMNSVYISAMLVSGLLTMEETGATVMASLPVVPRERAKSKFYLLFTIQTLSQIIPNIILLIILQNFEIFLIGLIFLLIVWNMLFNIFLLKIRFFGRMRYKYTIEEINKEHKIGKWLKMLIVQIVTFLGFSALLVVLTIFLGLITAMLLISLISIILLILQIFAPHQYLLVE
ncbi:MAG: hypothetical protein P8Y70_17950 [Candidatus Lokiarchaeota archaeon]